MSYLIVIVLLLIIVVLLVLIFRKPKRRPFYAIMFMDRDDPRLPSNRRKSQ